MFNYIRYLFVLLVYLFCLALGMLQHAHHAKVSPRFCKTYAKIGPLIQQALNEYREDVETGAFPTMQYSPYKVVAEEAKEFEEMLYEQLAKEKIKLKPMEEISTKQQIEQHKQNQKDHDETIKVY